MPEGQKTDIDWNIASIPVRDEAWWLVIIIIFIFLMLVSFDDELEWCGQIIKINIYDVQCESKRFTLNK